MYLKALRVKGFKSFAEPTVIEFEPGLTVIVGPNGSGKSNVVDALAWVLGAQGPRALRSGRMDDVIFAGTSTRPGLGRAEVEAVLADPSGLAELGTSEVSIRRAMLRSGDSEYAINGVDCRLADVQELLGRAGIGRQQHLLVTQGNLDSVLEAGPLQRRALIEEAAGIQQFRRRREQAERRLERTQADQDRMADLVRESARQLRPLRRQAEAAERFAELSRRRAHLERRLALAELARTSSRLARLDDQDRARRQRLEALEGELAALDQEAATLEHELAGQVTSWEAPLFSRAERAAERAAAGGRLVASRLAGVAGELGRMPEASQVEAVLQERAEVDAELAKVEQEAELLASESVQLEAEEATLAEELEHLRGEEASVDAELALDDDDQRGEQTVLEEARVALRRTTVELEQLQASQARATARLEQLEADVERADAEVAALLAQSESTVAEAAEHASRKDASAERLAGLEAAVEEAAEALQEQEREVARWRARREALAEGLAEARSRAGAERLADRVPLLGVLADLVEVDDGYERALEAAVGESGTGVVVGDPDVARAALSTLAETGSEGSVVVASVDGAPRFAPAGPLPPGSSPLARHVRARVSEVEGLLARLLADVVVVDGDWSTALAVHEAVPERVVVSTKGDRMSTLAWRVGVAGSGATAAALEVAEATHRAAEAALAERRVELGKLRAARDEERRRLAEAERSSADAERRKESLAAKARALQDRRARDVAELDALRGEAKVAAERIAVLTEAIVELEAEAAAAEAEVATWRERRQALRAERQQRRRAVQERRGTWERRRSALAALRRDFEARAAAAEERRLLLADRARRLEARAEEAKAAEVDVERRRSELVREREHLERLGAFLGELQRLAEELLGRCRQANELSGARLAEAAARLDQLRGTRRRLESERAELEEAARRFAADRRGLELEQARWSAALRPGRGVAEEAEGSGDEGGGAVPDDPDALQAELGRVEQALERLGPVNPLALAEVAEVQARHELLEAQLDDVSRARAEISSLLETIDAEILERFSTAFDEVARRFGELFELVFPGGRGSLSLDPDGDPFEAGVEVEARPPGKSVRRLSLLSGGERSLVAIAFLFAIFQSCPAPFYVMDEVEAALDDVNLSRFLDLVDRLRAEAQVILITHQRRTMERADRLLGVTMQPGGSTRVVAERLAQVAKG